MQNHPTLNAGLATALLATALNLALAGGSSRAGDAPTLWGYGVKPCSAFLTTAPAAGVPAELGDADYLRYREWLAGLVTGLNLATGSDVLAGAELDGALTRIRAHCKDHPGDDFFNASLALIKSLKASGREKK
jgi:hypothetical protein